MASHSPCKPLDQICCGNWVPPSLYPIESLNPICKRGGIPGARDHPRGRVNSGSRNHPRARDQPGARDQLIALDHPGARANLGVIRIWARNNHTILVFKWEY